MDEEDEWQEFNLQPAGGEPQRREEEYYPPEDTSIPETAQYTQGTDPWAGFNLQPAPKDEWAGFNLQPAAGQEKQPEAEGMLATGLRHFVHALPSVATGLGAGALYGAVGGPGGMIGGALAGGAAALGESYLQSKATEALFPEEAKRLQAGAEANPVSAVVGGVGAVAPFVGIGGLTKEALKSSVGQRAVSALLSGGTDIGQQAAFTGKVDPVQAGIQTAGGALFGGAPTALGRKVMGIKEPVPHGTPGAEAAAGTAEAQAPPPPGDEPKNTRMYGKDSKPTEPGAGVNVVDNGVDPTLAATFERSTPDIDAAVRRATGTEVPPSAEPSNAIPVATSQQEIVTKADLERAFPQFAERPIVEPSPPAGAVQEPTAPPLTPEPTTAAAARAPDDTMRGPAMDARLDEIGAGGSAAAPGRLREIAAQMREQGQEGRAKQFEQAALGIERSQQQQQQQQPGEMPSPTGGGQVPPPRPGAGVPPSEKPTLHMPATKSDLAQGLFPSLRRAFMPMKSESAQAAGAALREAAGPLARLKEQARTRFTNDLHQVANKMDQPAFDKFVDAYESGNAHMLPKDQQPLAKALERNYADFWKEIEKLPGTSKMEATKDFLTHMYDNSAGQVDKFASEWRGGGGGSLRKRTHPTFADARAAGLTQLSNNPIEHFGRYAESLSNHIAQRRVMADLEGQGRIGYFAPKVEGASGSPQPHIKKGPPEGYAEIKAPWAEKNGKRAYAPRDVAETLNQYYSAGMRNATTKDIYEFAQRTKNSWTAVELGLSAYHGTTMAVEATNIGMARALQMAARGDFAGATKQLVKAPGEFATSYLYGRELRKQYRGEETGKRGGLSGALDYVGEKVYGKHARSPETQEILDIFTKANVQPGNKPLTSEAISGATMREQDMSKLGNLWDAHKRGSLTGEIAGEIQKARDTYGLSIPKSTLDAAVRGVQTLSKPLFEHYIPELKLGSMMKDMETWLHANPTATREQKLGMARKIADSTDNRMGEMNYDNLFINKTAKDLGMLALRSFAFTVGGPIREIGGGAASLARGAMKGQNRLSPSSEHFDPRTAYAMAFLPTIAAISATYQYLRTGKGPEDWRDLVTPKTGGMIKSIGQQVPERILVPGYHKDFLGYFVNPQGPLHELEAKMAAPWTAIGEQITGKNWQDKDIVPPKASLLENIGARAKALGAHALPIGPKQLAEGTKKGSALTIPEQMIGVRTPGGYMLNPQGLDRFLTQKAQREWRASEQQTNRDRASKGLPLLPPRPPPRIGPP